MKISVFGMLSEHSRRPLHLVHISTPYKAIAQALPTRKYKDKVKEVKRVRLCRTALFTDLMRACGKTVMRLSDNLPVDGAEERKSSIVRYYHSLERSYQHGLTANGLVSK